MQKDAACLCRHLIFWQGLMSYFLPLLKASVLVLPPQFLSKSVLYILLSVRRWITGQKHISLSNLRMWPSYSQLSAGKGPACSLHLLCAMFQLLFFSGCDDGKFSSKTRSPQEFRTILSPEHGCLRWGAGKGGVEWLYVCDDIINQMLILLK